MNTSANPKIEMTKAVKWIIIVTCCIYIFLQVIAENIFQISITKHFALTPGKVLQDFFVWQTFTYMFLHTNNISHVLLSMLSLWFIGTELEKRWGSRFFLSYYITSGVGAALFYCFGVALYTVFTGNQIGLRIPVLGASGAIFGLLIAYAILFGERTLHFMLLFPMKAKVFVLILIGVELVSLLGSGVAGGEVANLAHLGGFLSGYLYLLFYTKWQRYLHTQKSKKKNRNLRLVVDNDTAQTGKKSGSEGPKYWN